MNQVEIYQTRDKQSRVEVRFEKNTVWLTQSQLISLFQRDQSVISRHIGNIFKERELEKKGNMHFLHIANSDKPVAHYNLDVIISVGYRVKSKRGVQFRKWATERLKDHLLKGYTLNEKRLKQLGHNMQQLEQAINLIQQSGNSAELSASEAKGLLEIISNYTQSFILLNRFDTDTLQVEKLNENITYEIEYIEAVKAIAELKKQLIKKKEASDLFGKERDQVFAVILNSVIQTFSGSYLY